MPREGSGGDAGTGGKDSAGDAGFFFDEAENFFDGRIFAQGHADGLGAAEGGAVWEVVIAVSCTAEDDPLFLFKNRKMIPEGCRVDAGFFSRKTAAEHPGSSRMAARTLSRTGLGEVSRVLPIRTGRK